MMSKAFSLSSLDTSVCALRARSSEASKLAACVRNVEAFEAFSRDNAELLSVNVSTSRRDALNCSLSRSYRCRSNSADAFAALASPRAVAAASRWLSTCCCNSLMRSALSRLSFSKSCDSSLFSATSSLFVSIIATPLPLPMATSSEFRLSRSFASAPSPLPPPVAAAYMVLYMSR